MKYLTLDKQIVILFLEFSIPIFVALLHLLLEFRKNKRFSSILIPITISLKTLSKHIVTLHNFGSEVAFNTKIKKEVLTNLFFHKDFLKTYKIWKKSLIVDGIGQSEIEPNKEGDYLFDNCLINLKTPFIIEWKNIDGKKRKSFWIISYNKKVKEISFFNFAKYKILLILKTIAYPIQWIRMKITIK